MKCKTLFLLLFTLTLMTKTQVVEAKAFAAQSFGKGGAASHAEGHQVATDSQGNIYAAGTWDDKTILTFPRPGNSPLELKMDQFAPDQENRPGSYLVKYGADGVPLWATGFPGTDTKLVNIRDLAIDGNDDLVVSGYFQGIIDFDPSPMFSFLSSGQVMDTFVIKLDPEGKLKWKLRINGSENPITPYPAKNQAIAIDNEKSIYIADISQGKFDADPGPGVVEIYPPAELYIIKLDLNGNFKWVKSFEDWGAMAWASDIMVDASQNIWVTGSFSNTFDADPNAGIKELNAYEDTVDVFVIKLNKNGNYLWAGSMGGQEAVTKSHSIASSSTGEIYLFGDFLYGTVDFDPGLGETNLNAPHHKFFITKLSNSGSLLWAKAIGNNGLATHYQLGGLAVDSSGNPILTGSVNPLNNPFDFDPGPQESQLIVNQNTYFLLKLDKSTGNLSWIRHIPLQGNFTHLGGSSGIDIDPWGNIITTGYFSNDLPVDFDLSPDKFWCLYSKEGDSFLLKLNQNGDLK